MQDCSTVLLSTFFSVIHRLPKCTAHMQQASGQATKVQGTNCKRHSLPHLQQLCLLHYQPAEPCANSSEFADTLQIQNALSRVQKEQTVEKLERAFEQSAVVYGMRFKNLSVSLSHIAADFYV